MLIGFVCVMGNGGGGTTGNRHGDKGKEMT